MKAFVTGSRVYGEPHPASDIDLIVLIEGDDQALLEVMSDSNRESGGDSLTFGGLNLICVHDQRAYDVWRQGTNELIARKPVTRDDAVETFRRLRKAAKVGMSAANEPQELAEAQS